VQVTNNRIRTFDVNSLTEEKQMITSVFPNIFFHGGTPKIIFDIPRDGHICQGLQAI